MSAADTTRLPGPSRPGPSRPVRSGPLAAPGLLAALLASLLPASGCVLRQPLSMDAAALAGELPERWAARRTAAPAGAATGWLADFGSRWLEELVREAVEGNHDLAAALARVEQARERAVIAGADRLPRLDAGLRTTRSQNLRGAAFQSVRANNFNLSFDLSWEADLWGRLRDLRSAELDRLDTAGHLHEAARLSLAANAARTAFGMVESRQQIALSRRTLSSLRSNLAVLDSRLDAGGADDRTALEISLSRADIARAESRILAEQQQLDAATRTLEALLGRYPAGALESASTLPRLSRHVPAGLPSELLLRRPDLLAAEARVDAALKELSAHRKALLPSVSITGSIGTATTLDMADLLDLDRLVWNIGQNLTQPLFHGGRLRANVRLAEHQRDELAFDYAETALTAFREVETALAAERYLAGQAEALGRAALESRRAEELSRRQYEDGLVDIITLLESQRRAFDAESALLSVQRELLDNRIDLHLALGGDFDSAPDGKGAPPPEAGPAAAARPRF